MVINMSTEARDQEKFTPIDSTILTGGLVGAISGFVIGLETHEQYAEPITEQPERTAREIDETHELIAPPYIFSIALIGAGIGIVASAVGRDVIKRLRS